MADPTTSVLYAVMQQRERDRLRQQEQPEQWRRETQGIADRNLQMTRADQQADFAQRGQEAQTLGAQAQTLGQEMPTFESPRFAQLAQMGANAALMQQRNSELEAQRTAAEANAKRLHEAALKQGDWASQRYTADQNYSGRMGVAITQGEVDLQIAEMRDARERALGSGNGDALRNNPYFQRAETLMDLAGGALLEPSERSMYIRMAEQLYRLAGVESGDAMGIMNANPMYRDPSGAAPATSGTPRRRVKQTVDINGNPTLILDE